MKLSSAQQEQYRESGFLVFDQLFSLEEMDQLKASAGRIVDDFDPDSTRSVFSTLDTDTNRDSYFLDSADKVRCFFEEEAFLDNEKLGQSKHLSINKIGHALHVLVPEFVRFAQHDKIAAIAHQLGLLEPQIRQSMYIFKQPKIGGEIRWHQDATYFLTQPSTVTTFWFAIEDANIENGCLQIDPSGGSFPLKEQFKRYDDDTTELIELHQEPWPEDHTAQPLEVKAGSLIVFNGNLPHYSGPNRSAKSRHAFTLHITSANAEYDKHNWLQAAPTPLK